MRRSHQGAKGGKYLSSIILDFFLVSLAIAFHSKLSSRTSAEPMESSEFLFTTVGWQSLLAAFATVTFQTVGN
jgi:hypothetical protein